MWVCVRTPVCHASENHGCNYVGRRVPLHRRGRCPPCRQRMAPIRQQRHHIPANTNSQPTTVKYARTTRDLNTPHLEAVTRQDPVVGVVLRIEGERVQGFVAALDDEAVLHTDTLHQLPHDSQGAVGEAATTGTQSPVTVSKARTRRPNSGHQRPNSWTMTAPGVVVQHALWKVLHGVGQELQDDVKLR